MLNACLYILFMPTMWCVRRVILAGAGVGAGTKTVHPSNYQVDMYPSTQNAGVLVR